MKPSRSRRKSHDPASKPEDDPEQAAGAASEAPLTPEERARLVAELEAALKAAERSIEEEGTISPEELIRRMNALLRELTAEEEEREHGPAKR